MASSNELGGATPSAQPAAPEQSQSNKTKVQLGPLCLEIDMPKWAVACLSVVVILASALGGGYFGLVKYRQMAGKVSIPADQMKVYAEQTKHQGDEEPVQLEIVKANLTDGKVTIRHFKNDGCVEILRRTDGKIDQFKWIFGPAAAANVPSPKETPSNTDVLGFLNNAFRPDNVLQASVDSAMSSGEVKSAVYDVSSKNAHLDRVQYGPRCLDPHPGAFTYVNQQINQCIIQTTRTFYDGCQHTQLFNACTGTWDVYPNGMQKVNWIRCLH